MVEIKADSRFPIMVDVCFSKTEVVISQPSVDEVWFAYRLLDLLKAAISTNAKPEIVLSGRGRHLDKAM